MSNEVKPYTPIEVEDDCGQLDFERVQATAAALDAARAEVADCAENHYTAEEGRTLEAEVERLTKERDALQAEVARQFAAIGLQAEALRISERYKEGFLADTNRLASERDEGRLMFVRRLRELSDERDAALKERDESRAEYHRENLAAAALQEKLDAARAALLEVVAEVLDAKRIATNINAAADQSDNGPELALLESLDEALAILEKEKP